MLTQVGIYIVFTTCTSLPPVGSSLATKGAGHERKIVLKYRRFDRGTVLVNSKGPSFQPLQFAMQETGGNGDVVLCTAMLNGQWKEQQQQLRRFRRRRPRCAQRPVSQQAS